VEILKVGNAIRRLRGDKKEVRKASRDSWRAFCNSISDLPMSARLHRALSRDPKAKLSSLVAPSGLRTQSEGETLELLMTTHFPDSIPFQGGGSLRDRLPYQQTGLGGGGGDGHL
jgi:hypothetical protein